MPWMKLHGLASNPLMDKRTKMTSRLKGESMSESANTGDVKASCIIMDLTDQESALNLPAMVVSRLY